MHLLVCIAQFSLSLINRIYSVNNLRGLHIAQLNMLYVGQACVFEMMHIGQACVPYAKAAMFFNIYKRLLHL